MSAKPKSRNVRPDQSVNYNARINVKNSGYTAGTSATYIAKHNIVTIDGSSSAAAYISVDEAIAGQDIEDKDLWVTTHELRDFGSVTRWALVALDTSAAAKGDAVYLSSSTAGAITLTASSRRVGTVVVAATVANGGLCFIDPVAHQASVPTSAAWEVIDDLTSLVAVESNWVLHNGSDAQALDPINSATNYTGGWWTLTSGNADGTVAADGSQMIWTGSPIQLDEVAGDTIIEFAIMSNSAITTRSIGCGLTDSVSLEEPFTNSADTITTVATDACGFLYDTDATTDEWWACAVDTGVVDAHATTGVAPVADTVNILRMEIANDGATIRYYVDNVLTNTLSAAGVGPDVPLYPYIVLCSTTTTSVTADADYCKVGGAR